MPDQRNEGYAMDFSAGDNNPPSSAAAWVGPLRTEARQALVRRIVMDRVEKGGYENFPEEKKYAFDWCRIAEAFAIGTAVAITSNLVIKWFLGKK